MPCGPRARLTAYVAYQTLTFAERDVLLAALADAGFIRVEAAPVGTETNNPLPLSDSTGRTVAGALVVHRDDLPFGFGATSVSSCSTAPRADLAERRARRTDPSKPQNCLRRAKAGQLAGASSPPLPGQRAAHHRRWQRDRPRPLLKGHAWPS